MNKFLFILIATYSHLSNNYKCLSLRKFGVSFNTKTSNILEKEYQIREKFIKNMMLLEIQKQEEMKRKIFQKYLEARSGPTSVLRDLYNRF